MLNDETLEERLHQDLDRFEPGFVPVDALISHGRAIKARRRAGFGAALAAVAALAVGTPVVLGGGGGPLSAPGAGHQTVLASGTIGGKQWSFVTGEPVPSGCPGGYVDGRWGDTSAGTCLGAFPAATDPVFLSSGGAQGEASFYIAQLRADVDHVTVSVTDGTVRTPAVAEVSGRRYAFFALPPKQGITRLDAYAADGKAIAYGLSYNGPDNTPTLVESWYPAGTTPTQAAVTRILLSDTTSSSTPVTATVDMGPFGVCFLVSAPQDLTGGTSYGPACSSLTPPAATELLLNGYPLGERLLELAEVNNAVDHVDLTLSDGTTKRLTPVRVGGHSFVAAFTTAGVRPSITRAYDASGTLLAKTP